MMRTRRPSGINKRVMEILLDLIDDFFRVPDRIDYMQTVTGSGFSDRLVVAMASRRFHVRTNESYHANLFLRGYSARLLESFALCHARLTGRHALLEDDVIAAEQL